MSGIPLSQTTRLDIKLMEYVMDVSKPSQVDLLVREVIANSSVDVFTLMNRLI